MESKIILGRLIQKLIDQGYANVEGYNIFKFVKLEESLVILSRENGNEAKIPFKRILVAIEGYQMNSADYNSGPNALRTYGLSHITSPIFSILHLLPVDVYGLR